MYSLTVDAHLDHVTDPFSFHLHMTKTKLKDLQSKDTEMKHSTAAIKWRTKYGKLFFSVEDKIPCKQMLDADR